MAAKATVAVWKGGPSGERAVSLVTGESIAAALRQRGYPVIEVEITSNLGFAIDGAAPVRPERAVELLRPRVDVVFPALHGPFGEDGTVQGFLEVCGLPYVGSGVAASALAMDKILTRRVVESLGVRLADAVEGGPRHRPRALEELEQGARRLTLPCFVKPACSGSSLGVTRVREAAEFGGALERALAEGGRVLVESGVAGREVSCPVLGDAWCSPRALPIVEIVPQGHDFFDYEAKYTAGGTDEICPARVDDGTARELTRLALLVHQELGCRSLSRSDFIVPADGGAPVFLEVNTLPGMTPLSLFPKAAATAGMPYGAMLESLVEGVVSRGSGRR